MFAKVCFRTKNCFLFNSVLDTTPLSKRTGVNAFFGVATAMGSALGPAIAIALDEADFEFQVPIYGNVIFNGMTG